MIGSAREADGLYYFDSVLESRQAQVVKSSFITCGIIHPIAK